MAKHIGMHGWNYWDIYGPTDIMTSFTSQNLLTVLLPPTVTLIGILAMTNAAQLAGLCLWDLHLSYGLPAFNNAQLAAQLRANTFP